MLARTITNTKGRNIDKINVFTFQTQSTELNEEPISSSESTASPLSEALPQKDEAKASFIELNSIVDQYKDKLKSFNALLSPQELFDPFDALFENYRRLKEEYCLQWKQQQSYQQEIQSMLKHQVLNQYDQLQQSLPLHEIQTLLNTLQTIQVAIIELFRSCLSIDEEQQPPPPPAQTAVVPVPDRSLCELSKLKQPKKLRIKEWKFNKTKVMISVGVRNLDSFDSNDYIGQNESVSSAFGVRRIVYCDWIGSGKCLRCIEKWIGEEILPLYTSMSAYRMESRSIILESLGGCDASDVVLFCGSSGTDAMYKLCCVLMSTRMYSGSTSLVFVSIYDSHFNIWKEEGIRVIVIPSNATQDELIDLDILRQHLEFYSSLSKYNLLIGSFPAACCVSGMMAHVDEITCLLHEYGALSVWDYGTAGPYCDIQMTNTENEMLSKDAVFVSTQTYLGGPGAPGILCGKKKLFGNYTPVVPGGGSMFITYGVKDGEWQYHDMDNIEQREDDDDALVFMMKDKLSTQRITKRQSDHLQYFWSECGNINNLNVLSSNSDHSLPIISLLIQHTCGTTTKYLHHMFIAALMSDLFGIEGRGATAHASHVLDFMTKQYIEHVVHQLRVEQNEIARPGYFRIHLHYTLNAEERKYIVDALKFVCKHGWLLLPLYDVDVISGTYYHRSNTSKPLRCLRSHFLDDDKRTAHDRHFFNCDEFDTCLESANDVISNLIAYLPTCDQFENEESIEDDHAWYWLPSELYASVMEYCSIN
eukprot:599847_1